MMPLNTTKTTMNSALEFHHSKIVLVTKGRDVKTIQKVLQKHKLNRIAENRVEEAEEKFPLLPPKLEKHFIGKLQSRKIPRICKIFDVIQSLENFKQAAAIAKHKAGMRVLIQVNISSLPQRSGCSIEELPELIRKIKTLPLQLEGIMGMATSKNPEQARKEFKELKSLQAQLKYCSMGMSDDYKIALEEGSNMLRLGRIMFS